MDRRGVDFIGAIADTTARAASQFARRGVEEAFRPEAFAYHPESDTYTCPAVRVHHYDCPGNDEYRGMATLKPSCRQPDLFGYYLEDLPSRGKT